MKLLVFHSFDNVNMKDFLSVFKESSVENATRWYPDLSQEEALQQYENGYIRYMQTDCGDEGGTLFILSDNEHYVSSLRLYAKAPKEYYLEALETHPDFRKKGYGKELLLQMQRHLREQDTDYVITAHVEKTNAASLNTHRAAGFEITADFVVEDGERYDGDYQLTYKI
jgi:ribosomal protein S18 acetylase RimI-like enzyme